MLTGADEFPFHQTAEPMAFAGTDRNFYDRFFFNGYSADGDLFFAIALGLYPQLDIMDGAVCVLKDGKQHNVRVSKRMNGERSALQVGPLSIDIQKPLLSSKIVLESCDSDISLELIFEARHAPVEEPRFTRRVGTRGFMDYTRLTQNINWTGEIRLGSEIIKVEPANVLGTRDRSWGIRPVGMKDSQPPAQGSLSQFFWLWNPCNFEDYVAFSHTNDDNFGRPWNRRAGIEKLGGELQEFENVEYEYKWFDNSRRIKSVRAILQHDCHEATIELTPFQNFYMSGLGYTHPDWGHGMDHGDSAFSYDVIDTAQCSDVDPLYFHIQAIARAELSFDGIKRSGLGVVEQLFIGAHQPSGMGDGLALLRGDA